MLWSVLCVGSRETHYSLASTTAQVVSQAGDGTLDLMPTDTRAAGLPVCNRCQSGHGLPGVKVKDMPPGENVLLACSRRGRPAAAVCGFKWHEGQVLEVQIGGTVPVALSTRHRRKLPSLPHRILRAHSFMAGRASARLCRQRPQGKPRRGSTPVVPQTSDPTAAQLLPGDPLNGQA